MSTSSDDVRLAVLSEIEQNLDKKEFRDIFGSIAIPGYDLQAQLPDFGALVSVKAAEILDLGAQ